MGYYNGNAAKKFKKRKFEKIQSVLRTAMKKYGLEEEISRYQFVLQWEEVVGKEIAKRTKPECIRNGALVVRVKNSVWAQELSFRKSVILSRLNRLIEDSTPIRDVHFYAGEL